MNLKTILVISGLLTILFAISCEKETENPSETVKDIDGNIYKTVEIGDQTWMAKNLAVTKYNDGTEIPLVTEISVWTNLTTPGYCWYKNDKATYGKTYGALYNWYVVETSRLCPSGWHVPTDDEWKTLEMTLGMSYAEADQMEYRGVDIGDKLKTTSGWYLSGGGSDESGFSALPGGSRHHFTGWFREVREYGYWWSSSEYSSLFAWERHLRYRMSLVCRVDMNKGDGYSVRCVKD